MGSLEVGGWILRADLKVLFQESMPHEPSWVAQRTGLYGEIQTSKTESKSDSEKLNSEGGKVLGIASGVYFPYVFLLMYTNMCYMMESVSK